MKYHAFISYSHQDKVWGDWLHRSLETYKVPPQLVGKATERGYPVPARVYPVFRDREELPTATDLGAVIGAALKESRYLVVICSPRSARSMWVNQEIINFKKLHGENRILALIVDGEPNAAEGKPGFTADMECFPEALKYHLGDDGELDHSHPTEPIAGDARPHADGKSNALLKLLAGILGVNYDDLRRRDELRKRRRLRIMLATVTALTLIFAALAVVAMLQSIEAKQQKAVAVTERDRAEVARVAAEEARRLAEEARRLAEEARRRTLESTQQIQESNVRQAVDEGRFDDALLWLEEVRSTRTELGLASSILGLRKEVYIPRLSRPDWSLAAPGSVTQVRQTAKGAPVWVLHSKGLFRAEPGDGGQWKTTAVPWPFEESEGVGVEPGGRALLVAADHDVWRFEPESGQWDRAAPELSGGVEGAVLTDQATGQLGWLRGTIFEIWDVAQQRVIERRPLPALEGFVDFTGIWDSAANVLAFKGNRAGERRMMVLHAGSGELWHDLPRTPAFGTSLTIAEDRLISVGSGGEAVSGELVLIPLNEIDAEPLRIVTPWRGRKVIATTPAGFEVMADNGAVHHFSWALEEEGEVVWLGEGRREQLLFNLPDGWLLAGNDGARWAQDWRDLATLPAKVGLPEGFAVGLDGTLWAWSSDLLAELDPETSAVRRFAHQRVDDFWPGESPGEGWAVVDDELQRLRLGEPDESRRMTVSVLHVETLPEKTNRIIGVPHGLAVVGESGGYEVDTLNGEVKRRWWRGPTALATPDSEGLWTVTANAAIGRLEVRRLHWNVEDTSGELRVLVDPAEVVAMSINRFGEPFLMLALADGSVLGLPLQSDLVSQAWYGAEEPVLIKRDQLDVVTGRSGRTVSVVERIDDGNVLVAYRDGGVEIFAGNGEQTAGMSPFGKDEVVEAVFVDARTWFLRSDDGGLARWQLGDNPRFERPPQHVGAAGTVVASKEGLFTVRETVVERWLPGGDSTRLRGKDANSNELSYVTLDPGRDVVVGLNRNGIGQFWPRDEWSWSGQGRDFPWGKGVSSSSFDWVGGGRLAITTPAAYLPDLTIMQYGPDAADWTVVFTAPLESLGVLHRGDHLTTNGETAWVAAENEPWLSRIDLVSRQSQRVALSESARELAVAGPAEQWLVIGMNSRIEWRDATTLELAGELVIPSRITGNRSYYTRVIRPLPNTNQVLVGTRATILQVDLLTGEIVHEYETDGYVWSIEVDQEEGRIDYVTDLGVGYLPLPATGDIAKRNVDELVPGRAIIQGGAANRVPGYVFDEDAR